MTRAALTRAALIRVVHATARRLALDEETRRAIYRRVTGCGSLTDMTEAQIAAVAAELRRLAPASPRARKGAGLAGAAEGGIRKTSPKAHVRLVYVLWWRLAEAGLVAEGAKTSAARRKALNAFINTRFKADLNGLTTDADFLSARLAVKVVEGLKAMAARAGLKLEIPR